GGVATRQGISSCSVTLPLTVEPSLSVIVNTPAVNEGTVPTLSPVLGVPAGRRRGGARRRSARAGAGARGDTGGGEAEDPRTRRVACMPARMTGGVVVRGVRGGQGQARRGRCEHRRYRRSEQHPFHNLRTSSTAVAAIAWCGYRYEEPARGGSSRGIEQMSA